MQDIPTKTTGDSLTAAEFNQIPDELENAIKSTGITLSGADLFQLAKAIADYSSHGDFYTETGVADAYVLTTDDDKEGITLYKVGSRVRFVVGNTNTGASTINVNGIGVKSIVKLNGAAILAGSMTAGNDIEAVYDGTNFVLPIKSTVDVTGSRVNGVTYTNNTGRELTVIYTSNFSSQFFIDGVQHGVSLVTNSYGTITLPIPSGSTYQITAANFISWSEQS